MLKTDLVTRFLGAARAITPPPIRAQLRSAYALAPHAWRRSTEYRQLSSLLARSQWWSADQLAEYQLGHLRTLVSDAAVHSPEYRRRFAEWGVGPSTLRSLDDLRRFPVLTKEDLRADATRFLMDDAIPSRTRLMTSGGTTGEPISFYHPQHAEDVFLAFRLALWKRIGYSIRRPSIDLTASFDAPSYWAKEFRTLYVSITHLGAREFSAVVRKVKEARPEYVIGFPSTVALFAALLRDHGVELPMRGVITGSEVLHPDQRALLSDTFDCRVLSWYGMVEFAAFAAGCEHTDDFHFSPEAGCLELIDDNGAQVTEPGKEGEIVVTGFHLRATPFLRYRTGDRAIWGAGSCAACGRHYPVVRTIVGREQDYLVGRWGRRIPNSALNVHDDLFDGAHAFQFWQESPGVVCLRIVAGPRFRAERVAVVRQRMQAKLGDDVTLEVRLVDEIPRTVRGKHRFIVRASETGQVRA